jgi:hypothetical protein
MASDALFIGWGRPVRGREAKSLEVFGEGLQYWNRLQQEGRIESFEPVMLARHGGDLAGFLLIRGDAEKLNAIRGEEEFARQIMRADLIVEDLGVVPAWLGEGLQSRMGLYQQAVAELT